MTKNYFQLGLFLSTYLSLIWLLPSVGQAQEVSLAGLDLSQEVQSWYDGQAGQDNSTLQTGIMIDVSRKTSLSHPYYKSGQWKNGDLVYRDQSFSNVLMIYNIEQDALIIKRATDGGVLLGDPIQLISADVDSFHFMEADFEYIDQKVDVYSTGFFEVLYQGQVVSLLAKRSKIFKINDEAKLTYEEFNRYYLRDGDQIERVKSLSGVKKRYKEHAKKLKIYAKQHKIKKLNPKREKSFATLIEYFDNQLIP
ncbi:hypothetical protein N7E81_08915 [Reichenbachiella carrageenanivorans]|uniref:Uncharacterized protein n=1 Tax=Reichenbachiella carrageenanivorans TaxID=2979869 RepID=A0ABY6DBK4_9BACT|nr:hypothetical protein [Reichenbachiella carrageenanivorans]UXX81215.1 hypothetical protein N7E81_08915 [Reichenbachiella carrageenanivorans]